MAQATPLMPHATATWLVDHTGLSFEQIANFCGLHILEVQAMADDLAASKYTGRDPLHSGELTQEEIARGEADASYELKMQKAPVEVTRTKGPRYTPVSKRQDKPDGIAWILRNHSEISDAQISKLIGTTRNTINAIRERSHWNIQNIQPKDPVTLGLCSQRELDAVVAKAAKRAGVAEGEAPAEEVVVDGRSDKDKLIAELRAEREANVKAAAEAAQEAEAEAWLEQKREAEAAGEAPIDPESAFADAPSQGAADETEDEDTPPA
ncbi:cell cycle transcriptional regulator TrcR [Altererythrobacter sp. GH1-8]|uniref:cell cycle transcriptional regulator TrcR n=1 Tax=Altererythrobacter sp. GH1-8 TaxID=3349333 RepID=UPI00374DB8B0